MDVTVDGEQVDGKTGSVSGSTIVMNLPYDIDNDQAVKVSYDNVFAADAVGLFRDGASNALQNFGETTATNNSTQEIDSPGPSRPDWAVDPVVSVDEITMDEGSESTFTVSLSENVESWTEIAVSGYPGSKLSISPSRLIWDTGLGAGGGTTVTLTASQDSDEINYWTRLVFTFSNRGSDETYEVYGPRVLIEDDDDDS